MWRQLCSKFNTSWWLWCVIKQLMINSWSWIYSISMFHVKGNWGFCFSRGAICLFLCTIRSFHLDWGQHLHQVLKPGHGRVPEDRVPGGPHHGGCVLRLVLSHSLALLQPGGGHWPAAHASCQNNSDEGTLWLWCNHRHVIGHQL